MRLFHEALLEHGYVVISIDYRLAGVQRRRSRNNPGETKRNVLKGPEGNFRVPGWPSAIMAGLPLFRKIAGAATGILMFSFGVASVYVGS
jgi:hypothetical protein